MRFSPKLLSVGIIVAISCVGAAWMRPRPTMPKIIRAGYFIFPPYLDVKPDGGPSGFVVDAFAEAAKRRGVQVEWVNTKGSPDKALLDRRIDVYPLMAITPERSAKLGMSEPWWENTLVMASRAERPVKTAKDLEGETISIVNLSFGATLARRHFPKSTMLGTVYNAEVLNPVCDGRAIAAMTEARVMNLWLMQAQRPCPGVSFYVQPFDELVLRYGVGALKENAWLAAEMQSTLLDLTIDGSLNRIGAKWNVFATNQIGVFRDLVRVKDQRLWLALTLLIFGAVLMGIAMMYYRMLVAQRGAVAAAAMQSQFLANVSHEIRTPLNGILGMVDLLRSTPMQAAQREFTDAIASSGQVLLALINDFLDLAKIEAGKLELEKIVFSPLQMTEQVVLLFYPRAHESGISIGAYIEPSIPATVIGDPTRIQQVLFNLVGNAVKFTTHGDVWIEVDLSGEGGLRFSVLDTGAGVPDEARSRLFQRFTQADASTTRIHGGTGLGLAICRDLVNMMGGAIGFEPREGGGSRFWFTIAMDNVEPVAVSEIERRVTVSIHDICGRRLAERLLPALGYTLVKEVEDSDLSLVDADLSLPVRQSRILSHLAGLATAPSSPAANDVMQLSLRILVAEDNAVNQRVAMHYLRKLGCEATLVQNGELAVAAALANDFDAIMMDYQMPVMDGLSAARKIRAAGGRRGEVPILAVTAGVLAVDLEKIRAAGMDDLLAKPYSIDALRLALQAASKGRRGILQR